MSHPIDTQPEVDLREQARIVTLSWEIGPCLDHYGQPAVQLVQLSTFHHTGQFVSTVAPATQRDGMIAFVITDQVTILRTPCARYSAKGLAAAAADAAVALRRRVDSHDSPKIDAMFTVEAAAA